MKTMLFLVCLPIALLTGCVAPQVQKAQTPESKMSVAQRVSALRIGQTMGEVYMLLEGPDQTRSEEGINGVLDVWLYSRDTLIARFQGAGASFMSGFSRTLAGVGPPAPLELRFLDHKLITIVNR